MDKELWLIAQKFERSVLDSVRPNTEYSAEYSVKIGRIFGAEYSVKVADSRIPKKRQNCAILGNFSQKIGQKS